jgi:hypothetical protein
MWDCVLSEPMMIWWGLGQMRWWLKLGFVGSLLIQREVELMSGLMRRKCWVLPETQHQNTLVFDQVCFRNQTLKISGLGKKMLGLVIFNTP